MSPPPLLPDSFHVYYFRTFTEWQLHGFKEYVTRAESNLDRMLREEYDFHAEQVAGFDQQQEDDYFDHVADDTALVHTTLPAIQRQSDLISIYALLEHTLAGLSSLVGRIRKSRLSLKHIAGRGGIDASRIYLECVLDVDFPTDSATWREIRTIQKIRNRLVHNGGQIPDNDEWQHVRSYITKSNYLEFQNGLVFTIGAGYSEHVLNLVEDLFSTLFKAIPEFAKKGI